MVEEELLVVVKRVSRVQLLVAVVSLFFEAEVPLVVSLWKRVV